MVTASWFYPTSSSTRHCYAAVCCWVGPKRGQRGRSRVQENLLILHTKYVGARCRDKLMTSSCVSAAPVSWNSAQLSVHLCEQHNRNNTKTQHSTTELVRSHSDWMCLSPLTPLANWWECNWLRQAPITCFPSSVCHIHIQCCIVWVWPHVKDSIPAMRKY